MMHNMSIPITIIAFEESSKLLTTFIPNIPEISEANDVKMARMVRFSVYRVSLFLVTDRYVW